MTSEGLSELEVQRITCSRDIVQYLEPWLNEFTAPPGDLHRLLPAGLLARSVALLRTLDLLLENGLNDVSGMMLRSIFEANIVALYVALGGQKELDNVVGEFRRNVENLIERNKESEFAGVTLNWDYARMKISIEQIATDVGPLLAANGDQSGDAMGMYDSGYRATSTYDVHGTGAASHYLDASDQSTWRIETRPSGFGFTAKSCIALGAMYTGWVSSHIFAKFDFDTDRINELLAALVEALQRDS